MKTQVDNIDVIDEVSKAISKITGVQLGERQRLMVETRVKKRLYQLKFTDWSQYWDYLQKNRDSEIKNLVSLLTTHHTFFFREFSHFEYLENTGLKVLVEAARARGQKKLRIWCAACSRGQEVYSLSMFFKLVLSRIAPDFSFEIFGSDVDPESVEIARNGVYHKKEINEIPLMYRGNHWSYGKGEIAAFAKAKASIKDPCKFSVINLINFNNDLVNEKFDLVFCRNVFIYFTPEQIKDISQNIIKRMHPGGIYIIGISESIKDLGLPLSGIEASVYQTHGAVSPKQIAVAAVAKLPPPPRKPDPILKVLCVDDAAPILLLMKQILSKANGFEVVGTATSADAAHEFIKKNKVDLVTLDIYMPGKTGIDYLQEHFKKDHPPVIMVSAATREDKAVAQKALDLGAADYVEKPALNTIKELGEEIRNKLRVAYKQKINAGSAELAAQPVEQKVYDLIKSNTIMDARTKEKYHVLVRDCVLVTAKNLSLNTGSGVYFTKEEIEKNLFENTLNILYAGLCPKKEAVEFKLFGASLLLRKVRDYLEKQQKPIAKLTPHYGDLEFMFTPASGRLQLAKSPGPVSASEVMPLQKSEPKKIKVLIVDDSDTIRKMLQNFISKDPSMEVVGMAALPSQAEELIARLKPDVITLDIHMPEMDGVTLLKRYIRKYPIPTIIISSVSREEGNMVLSGLEAGAVDYLQKPSFADMTKLGILLLDKIRTASIARVRFTRATKAVSKISRLPGKSKSGKSGSAPKLIVVGSSTGGPDALKQFLTSLPESIPPILIVQHIPPVFSAAMAERFAKLCPFKVMEAQDQQLVLPNQVLIAPGGSQMRLKKQGDELKVIVDKNPPPALHQPSVNELFESVANQIGGDVIAVILTGMGSDGATGMKRLKQLGARTIVQNEESCVVFGMPQMAIKQQCVDEVLHLDKIADTVMEWFHK